MKANDHLARKKKILSAYATNAVTATNAKNKVARETAVLQAKVWVDENHL